MDLLSQTSVCLPPHCLPEGLHPGGGETLEGVEWRLSQTETLPGTLAVGMETGAAPLGDSGAEDTRSSDSAGPLQVCAHKH